MKAKSIGGRLPMGEPKERSRMRLGYESVRFTLERARLHVVNIYCVTTLYKMLLKSISGACNGCVFGICTEGADVLAMQGVALIIAGTMGIVMQTFLPVLTKMSLLSFQFT